jgi:hypothetical protein
VCSGATAATPDIVGLRSGLSGLEVKPAPVTVSILGPGTPASTSDTGVA